MKNIWKNFKNIIIKNLQIIQEVINNSIKKC